MEVTEPAVVWLYAITRPGSGRPAGGLGGQPVRQVTGAGLAALVSDVPLAQFGAQALRGNLEDLDWLDATARAHHQVIAAAAAAGPVLPMRMATVYTGDDGIAALLANREAEFRAALGHVANRQEWGVKAHLERTSAARQAVSSGADYLRMRRAQLRADRVSQHEAARSAQAVHLWLAAHAHRSRLYPPQSARLSGDKAAMLLNAAYLVDADHGSEFTRLVKAAGQQHPDIRLVLTGPWPAYSFTGALASGAVPSADLPSGAVPSADRHSASLPAEAPASLGRR